MATGNDSDRSSRKLAAIVFADIAGYTALMQTDEHRALLFLNKFKEVLEFQVPSHHGSIVQYYGDGCLLSFESSTKSVACAKVLQDAFLKEEVPVRIGIHLGDVVFKENNVFGDGVNIASRIESMGIPGSVLVSKTIRDQIKNKSDFQLASLGSFEFKNVEEPMEVYALTNDGLAVPDPKTVQGKFKATSPHAHSFFQVVWDKKIPQILLVYFVISWILLQFASRALTHFQLAPQLSDVLFICIVGIVPSLLVYLNNRDRIRRFSLTTGEKVLFPSNLLAVGLLLFFLFRGTDLGAMTKTISFTNADGVEEKQSVVKEQYRMQFVIYPFEQLDDDTTHAWLHLSLPIILHEDLMQDKYLTPFWVRRIAGIDGTDFSTIDKINYSKRFEGEFYIDGNYQFDGGRFEITPEIHDKVNGQSISKRRFAGPDLLSLFDSVTVFIREAVGLTQEQIEASADLKYADWVSGDTNAVRYYNLGGTGAPLSDLERATEIDPDLAMAWYYYADRLHGASLGREEAERAIDIAMQLRRKLPYQYQIAIMTLHHLIRREWHKAEQLLKIQLEIEPGNDQYNGTLAHIYFATSQMDKLVDHTRKRFEENPTPAARFQLMRMLLMQGQLKETISLSEAMLVDDPENMGIMQYQAVAYCQLGEYDRCREIVDNMILIFPEVESLLSPAYPAIDYMETHPADLQFLATFEGIYRRADRELIAEHRILNNHLLVKNENGWGIYLYPIDDSTFIIGSIVASFRDEYAFNQNGNVYAKQTTATRRNGIMKTYSWKQDSLIWQAEALLRNGDYQAADIAYARAIEANPEHHYLQKAKQHVDYFIATPAAEIGRNYAEYEGQYGPIKLFPEDGHFYVKIPGNPRFKLRPISDTRFITLTTYDQLFEIAKENGQVTGVNQYLYDNENRRWGSEPAMFFARNSSTN